MRSGAIDPDFPGTKIGDVLFGVTARGHASDAQQPLGLIWRVPHATVPMNVGAPPPTREPNAASSKKPRLGRLTFLATVVVALLGLAGYVATGPYRTLSGLQTAIARGDAAALSQYVDFPALRQNLKDQLNARANNGVNSTFQNGIASRIVGGIAASIIDGTVNSLVTPVGLNRLLMGAAFVSSTFSDNGGQSLQNRIANGQRSFESLSTFTLAFSSAAGSDLVIVLTRSGLDWQLTNVRIPGMSSLVPQS